MAAATFAFAGVALLLAAVAVYVYFHAGLELSRAQWLAIVFVICVVGVGANVLILSRAVRPVLEDMREQEALMNRAQRLTQTGSFGWSAASNRLRWSDETYRLHGHDPALGEDPWQVIESRVHPDDRPRFDACIRDGLRGASPGPIEYRVVWPDGSEHVLRVGTHVERDDGGHVTHTFGIVQDVTARRAAEQQYRSVVAALAEGVVVTDAAGDIIECNASAERILGAPREHLLGRNVQDPAWSCVRVDGTPFPPEALPVMTTLATGQPVVDLAMGVTRADGARVWISVNTQPIETGTSGRPARVVASFTDITRRLEAEAALRESERRLAEAQRIARIGSWVWDVASGQLYWSEETYRILGVDPATFQPTYERYLALLSEDVRAQVERAVEDALERGLPFELEHPYRCYGEARECILYARARVRRDANGKPVSLYGFVQDVTEQRAQGAQMRKLSRALQQTADSVIITDIHGNIEYVNEAFTRMTGYTAAEAIGQTPRILRSGKQGADYYRALWQRIRQGGVFNDILINRRKDGSYYYEEKTITPLTDASGRITHFVSTGKDITERMRSQEQLQHMAHHDALTELPNRTLFLDRLKQAIAHARWHRRHVGVLFIDLDRFKHINDSLGHDAGDVLLKALSRRFTAVLRERDTVARLGGDEFAIVIVDVASEQDIASVAQKVLDALGPPLEIAGRELFVTASIGVSIFPEDGEDATSLLKHADLAMYRAKELGKNTYQFYSADMSARAFERLSMEHSLRRALARGELTLLYQPQVDAAGGRIFGVEALLRWQHPELGLVAPGDFIMLLEETGLIVAVGEWVLDQACAQLGRWHRAGWPGLRLAVNLSVRQLQERGFVQSVVSVLDRHELPPTHLELELTESMLMSQAGAMPVLLGELSALGLRLALDDFGTGYSSLGYLGKFPLNTLKIDRSFVHGLPVDRDSRAIASSITALAASLDLELIAEGVETAEQRDYLLRSGCSRMQGHLFHPPLPPSEVDALLGLARTAS